MEIKKEIDKMFHVFLMCGKCNKVLVRRFMENVYPSIQYYCPECGYTEYSAVQYPLLEVTYKGDDKNDIAIN